MPMLHLFRLLLVLWPLSWAEAADVTAPEAASGRAGSRAAVLAEKHMAAAAHPMAAMAGLEILRQGGSAADAAIAMQLVLGLVEPQSSGLGGGGFLLYWDASKDEVTSLDGRETAPLAAKNNRFLDAKGKNLSWREAMLGGKSIGAPGIPRLLEELHRRHGRLPWADLFAPALRLAEDGFPISQRLARLIAEEGATLALTDAGRAYFFDDGLRPKSAGTWLKNPAYAQVLREMAQKGTDVFYSGELAKAISEAAQNAPAQPGDLTKKDLAAYQALARPPLCRSYREYEICGMGPPSAGGIAILQILGFLEPYAPAQLSPPQLAHLLAEAERLAMADRNRWIADPAFAFVPTDALIDKNYLKKRGRSLRLNERMPEVSPGDPLNAQAGIPADDAQTPEIPATSHFSAVDSDGNAISFTSSIEAAFGSHVMARGFLLNNQLTDFSFRPQENNRPVANGVEPGKRPRSSMSPTLVFQRNDRNNKRRLVLTVGSPGGARIIPYVAQALVAVLDLGRNAQEAAEAGHIQQVGETLDLEKGSDAEALAPALTALGHKTRSAVMTSGLHLIRMRPDGRLEGGADPRREGVALGD